MKTNMRRHAAVFVAFCMTLMQTLLFPEKASADVQPDFSILGAVGDFTAEETQAIAEVIYDGLAEHAEEIVLQTGDLPRIGVDDASVNAIGSLYRSVVANWDVGILTNKNSMYYRPSQKGLYSVIPVYLVEDASYDSEYARVTGMLDEIAAGVQSDWSAPEKALYLHEWMAVRYEYDNTEYEDADAQYLRHTAYGMLLNDMAVCEGYAWLYGLLLRRVGVESQMVVSYSLNHAWNMLYIDDAWYHVDVTWDDAYGSHPGLVSHDSFLKGESGIEASEHVCTDWELITGTPVSELNVSDKYDNGFWVDSITAAQPTSDGRWYVIRQDAETSATGWFMLCDFDAATAEAEEESLMSLSDRWYTSTDSSSYYIDSFIAQSLYEEILYYTAPGAMYALKDGEVIWLFNLTDDQKTEGSIYGMYVEDGIMYYYVSLEPTETPVEYTVDIASFADVLGGTASETTTESETTASETTTTETETTAPETTTESETTASETTTTESETTTPENTTTESETTATETTTTESETTASETTTTESETTAPETTTTESETTVSEITTEPETTTETTTTEEEQPIYGDVNGDDAVTIVDVIALQRYLLDGSDLTEQSAQNADLTQDGRINAFDLAMLKRMLGI